MATLTVQVNTGTDASPTWTSVDADQAEIVKCRGRGGYATFRIPNADVTDRTTLVMGRTVRLKLVSGSSTQWFKGPLKRPRVISRGPGVFDIDATVGELAEMAKRFPISGGREYPQDLQAATTTEFAASADAEVRESSASTNFGSATTLNVGFEASATPPGDERQVFMQFDISSLDVDDAIVLAFLRLHVTIHANMDQSTITLHRAESLWSESTITWNNKPEIDDDQDSNTGEENKLAELSLTKYHAGHTQYIGPKGGDLTDYYQQVHAGTVTDNGFAIKMATVDEGVASSQLVTMVSSEDTSDALKVPKLFVIHQPSVLVSDVVEDLFTDYWSDVDITGIQATNEFVQLQTVKATESEIHEVQGIRFNSFDSLYDAMELLTQQVAGWEWWLDTTDGDDIVLHFEQADQGAASGIGESDIVHPFELTPENEEVVNHVIVFGPTSAQDGSRLPVWGDARSSASESIYGYRFKVFHEPALASRQLLKDRAAAILLETQAEYWSTVVEAPGHKTLLPGRQVTLNLSNYGLDGTNFQNEYIVQETRDVFELSRWTRNLVLREYIT